MSDDSFIIEDSTTSYRADIRSNAVFEENLRRGLSGEARIVQIIVDYFKGIDGVVFSHLSSDRVNSDPDLTVSFRNKSVKIEIQLGRCLYTGYKQNPLLAPLGPVFHIKEHKIRRLGLFHGENKRGYICHHNESAGQDAIYMIRHDNLRGNRYGGCVVFGGKNGYIVPSDGNLIEKNLLPNVLNRMLQWLKE